MRFLTLTMVIFAAQMSYAKLDYSAATSKTTKAHHTAPNASQKMAISQNLMNYDALSFDGWLNFQNDFAEKKLLESMSYPDLAPGALVASPSRSNPDYYYHWVRDAGLVMDVVINLYLKTDDQVYKSHLEQKIRDFVTFSRSNQLSSALTGLGEPKFYVNGAPYNLPWGRPQNDGPAIRAIALIKWAKIQLAAGHGKYVTDVLYDGKLPSSTVIKADLEFVAQYWKDSSFDLWEEVSADHFFTRMVQRAALLQGAELAQALGDYGASDWYLRQAHKIESAMNVFINSKTPFIPASFNYAGGLDAKKSNIDIAVVLGLLRGNNHDGYLNWNDRKVTQTLNTIINTFSDLYSVNKVAHFPGVAIGRYPEDVYDGNGFGGGNPWVLTTLAVAESYYEMAAEIGSYTVNKHDQNVIAKSYLDLGDSYFQRVQLHANPDGSLSEQINRFSGHMTGARDLTWSYASVLTATWARERAIETLK